MVRKTLTIHGSSLQLRSMSVSNSVFVLCLLTAQELIAPFSMNMYRASGPNFARRCIAECRCYLRQTQNQRTASCMLLWPVLKNYILWWVVGLCIDYLFSLPLNVATCFHTSTKTGRIQTKSVNSIIGNGFFKRSTYNTNGTYNAHWAA